MRRGGALLTADVDEHQVDEAVRVLEEDSNSIDIDERAGEWRSSGWDYEPGAYNTSSSAAGGIAGGAAAGFAGTMAERDGAYVGDDYAAGDRTVQEEAIPVVEEELLVGKREVERGSVRVRSYVTEVPVHEQLRLRNERVDVERRRVDQPIGEADADAFRERTVEVTARGEEAVVSKEARVVEEVIVRKSADEELREIDDTVRRTDVEVEGAGTGTTPGRDRY